MILHSIHEVGAPNPTGHYAVIRDSEQCKHSNKQVNKAAPFLVLLGKREENIEKFSDHQFQLQSYGCVCVIRHVIHLKNVQQIFSTLPMDITIYLLETSETCKDKNFINQVCSLKSGMGGGQEQLYFAKLETKSVRFLSQLCPPFIPKYSRALK